jgi:hypothetical protein
MPVPEGVMGVLDGRLLSPSLGSVVPVPEGAVVGVIPADAGLVFAVVRGRWGLDSVLVRY